MRRAIVLLLLLSACTTSPPPAPYGADVEPLDANGLPPQYSLCVRQKAYVSAALHDVYYPCKWQISYYLARLGGLSIEEKSAMVDDMTKRALHYAEAQVIERHGEEAVRRTVTPPKPPPTTFSTSPDGQMKKWAECSVRALLEATGQGKEPAASIAHAKALCGYLWTGSPEVAERLYSKMMVGMRDRSVSPPGDGVGNPAWSAEKTPRELRF